MLLTGIPLLPSCTFIESLEKVWRCANVFLGNVPYSSRDQCRYTPQQKIVQDFID